MKIELPLETWTEVFGFVPRSLLKLLVPHIEKKRKSNRRWRKCQQKQTIGDRQFVSFIQFFLHKCGEVTLGKLRIRSSRNGNRPIVIANEEDRNLLLADVPMPIPGNIKDFESIHLSNYDESVIVFLQEFQRNFLLTNVNLYFHDCPQFLWEIMTNFLPLFTNINSIGIDSNKSDPDLLDQFQCEYSEVALPMLTAARILLANYNCRDSWFCDWLRLPREDGKSRVLFLCGFKHQSRSVSHSHFIKQIKKDFTEANQAVSFFIKLYNFHDNASVQSLILENGQTQEKLVIKGKSRSRDFVRILRYPIGTNEKEWVEEMSQHTNTHNRTIEFNAHPY